MNTDDANQVQVDITEPNMDDVDAHGYHRPVAPSDDDVDAHGYRSPVAPSDDDVDGHCLSPQSRLTDDYIRPGRPGPHSQRSAADTEDDVQGHIDFDDPEAHLKR